MCVCVYFSSLFQDVGVSEGGGVRAGCLLCRPCVPGGGVGPPVGAAHVRAAPALCFALLRRCNGCPRSNTGAVGDFKKTTQMERLPPPGS